MALGYRASYLSLPFYTGCPRRKTRADRWIRAARDVPIRQRPGILAERDVPRKLEALRLLRAHSVELRLSRHRGTRKLPSSTSCAVRQRECGAHSSSSIWEMNNESVISIKIRNVHALSSRDSAGDQPPERILFFVAAFSSWKIRFLDSRKRPLIV